MTGHIVLGGSPHLMIPNTDFPNLCRVASGHPRLNAKTTAPDLLAAELERAEVVMAEALPWNVVTMHARVEYRDDVTDHVERLTLVYPDEEQWDETCVSVLSPLGAAVLGLSEGQSIQWRTPTGGIRGVTILHVIFQPYQVKHGWQSPRPGLVSRTETSACAPPSPVL